MKIRSALYLSLLAGAQAANIYGRQNTASGDDDDDVSVITSAVVSGPGSTTVEVVTLTTDIVSETSTEDVVSETPSDVVSESSTAEDPVTDTTTAGDTTITRTVTVTDDNVETVSRSTTVLRTITSYIMVTSTVFETETVTSDGDTATKVVWETSTSWINEKRNLAPRTVALEAMSVDAQPTATAIPDDVIREDFDLRFALLKRGNLAKRATVTEVVTVTDSNDSGTTVFASVTRNVISTVTSQTKSTSTITETEVADAATTETVTSTLVVRSTRVTTGVVQTITGIPSGEYGPDETAAADPEGTAGASSGSGDSGLSTGAKAGIGAGVGVGALVVIAGLLWFCLKKRRNQKVDHDDMFGSSEVPVGPSHGANPTTPNMSATTPAAAAAAGLVPSRNTTVGSQPEGYRGTALGDGRAGYAKPGYPKQNNYMPVSPETNYTRTTASPNRMVSPANDVAELNSPANTAELASDSGAARWHQDGAAEIDGSQIHNPQGSAPPSNVYEMPAQPYR